LFSSSQASLAYDLSPPDWRWRQACRAYNRGKKYRKRPEDLEWLRPLRELVKVASGRHPSPRIPIPDELGVALSFFQSGGQERWQLEARILAGQTDREIAAAMRIPQAVVAAYEQSFFSMRHRLGAVDFVLSEIIGYTPFRGFDEGDWQSLWAFFAYTAGPKMLEVVMSVSPCRPLPGTAAPNGADEELLKLGTRAMLLLCTGTMTCHKLQRLQTLRRQRASINAKGSRPVQAVNARVEGHTPKRGRPGGKV
jgi:hypothetical protein